MSKQEGGGAWHDALRQRLRAVPDEYEECYASLIEVSHFVRAGIAEALQARLNAHLALLPQDTYEEKQAVATWVNRELHELGLTIRCPKTGGPAILVADVRGGDDPTSRFRLEVRQDDGRKVRTYTANRLPALELMEEPPRRENFARRSSDPPPGRGR